MWEWLRSAAFRVTIALRWHHDERLIDKEPGCALTVPCTRIEEELPAVHVAEHERALGWGLRSVVCKDNGQLV